VPDAITPLDGAVLAVLLIALGRGLLIGLIREGFSLAALAAAVLVTRHATPAAAAWLERVTGGQIGSIVAPWIAGAVIVLASGALVALIGRWLRRGVREAGLGWADRLGGAALGTAEGVVVAMLIVFAASWMLGREAPSVADSRSLAAYDQIRTLMRDHRDELPQVAAPGAWKGGR